jgi:hypothetical protein
MHFIARKQAGSLGTGAYHDSADGDVPVPP